MRVLVIHTYYKLKGGEDSVVANEVELLRLNGVEVEQMSFSNSGSTLLKLLQVPFNYGSYRKTIRKVQEFKPDVVHIHNLHFSGSAAVVYALKKLNVPIVMTLHNYRLLCPSGSLYHDHHLFMDSLKPGFAWAAVKNGVYQNSKAITFWIAAAMYLHEKLGTWNKVDRFILLGQHSRELFAGSKLAFLADRMIVKPNFCFPVSSSYPASPGTVQAPLSNAPSLSFDKVAPSSLEAATSSAASSEVPLSSDLPLSSDIPLSSDAITSLDRLVWSTSHLDGLQDAPYYLYVGRLTEEKGLPVLLEAFKDSLQALKIIGTGPLEDLVKEYSIKYPNISFAGAQPKEQVYEVLQGASALIFPSVWYETFGMVVIEAFSAGVPVIASDLGNIKNMIADGINGLRFKAGDPADLKKKILMFDQFDHIERESYRQNARNTYLKHYSPEANAAQLIELYLQLPLVQ
jgi:glycosyltransferase involved in cell wall biosynthesis